MYITILGECYIWIIIIKYYPIIGLASFFDLVPSKELCDRYEVFRDFDDSYIGIYSNFSMFNHNSANILKELVRVREYETQEVWDLPIRYFD